MELYEVVREFNRKHCAKAIAQKIGRTEFSVHKYAEDPEESGSPIPGNLILSATLATGDPSIIKYLANEAGYSLVKNPDAKHTTKSEPKLVAKEITEMAQTLHTFSKAIEDGKIQDAERLAIIKKCTKGAESLLGLAEELK